MKAYIKPQTETYDVALGGIIAESPFTVDSKNGVDAGESLVREEELEEELEW